MADLLDMAEPGGMPNFNEMMNATAPRMQTQAPYGTGAAIMFGQDSARHDAMVAQALKLAKLRAQMDAQKADEFSASGPGRMAEIQLKSAQAKDALNDPNSVAVPRAKRSTEMAQLEAQKSKAELAGFSDYLNAYDGAKSPTQRAYLQKLMASKNLKFQGTDIGSLSSEDFDSFMSNMRSAQVNDEKMAQFQTMWGAGGTKERIAESSNSTKRDIAKMQGEFKEKVARIAAVTGMTPDKVVGGVLQKVTQGITLSPPEKEVYMAYHELKVNGNETRAALAQPQVTQGTNGNFSLTKPQVPRPQTPGFAQPDTTPTPQPAKLEVLDKIGTSGNPATTKDQYDKLPKGGWYKKNGNLYQKP